MRTLASLVLFTAACSAGPEAFKDPPILKVTSPARALVTDGTSPITVTGTVAPNAQGDAIDKVLVNNVQATVGADGSFTAQIQVPAGASLIRTIANDVEGGQAEDTRSVAAGEQRAAGANIENAVTADLSAEAFAKIAEAAGPIIKGLDIQPMLASMNPMIHKGDEDGEDCLFARVFIDDVKFSDVHIGLVPKDGGISFRFEVDDLDVPGHARYAAACIHGTNTLRVTASKVVVTGTLVVTPDGMKGFATTLANPDVQMTNFHLDASGFPGAVLDLIDMDNAIKGVIASSAEKMMNPMMNQALGALAGPQTVNVLGKNVTAQVDPSDVVFDAQGGLITMDMTMLIEGTDAAQYIYTPNGMPNMDAGQGFQLGLADDLANELMSELKQTGLLDLTMPVPGGMFDTAALAMTLPPMISADPADGKMKVVLPDMTATFTSAGTPVAKAAINATVELQIVPGPNGFNIAIQLGTPEIHVNVLDDIPNATHFANEDLAAAVEITLGAQIDAISKLLTTIPLPSVAGLYMRDLSVGADDGYVMMKGNFQ